MQNWKHRLKDNKGMIVVEFIMLFPLLLVIGLFIIITAIGTYQKMILVDATREAVRDYGLTVEGDGFANGVKKAKYLMALGGMKVGNVNDGQAIGPMFEITDISPPGDLNVAIRVTYHFKSPVPGLGFLIGSTAKHWQEIELSHTSEFKREVGLAP